MNVFRKHGKLISFFRSFILSRPTRRTLKQSGILKERVFGCDLGEHLENSGRDCSLSFKVFIYIYILVLCNNVLSCNNKGIQSYLKF